MSEDSKKSKPNRIPVQKQMSPEREAQLEKLSLEKAHRLRKRYFFRNVGIALLVVGLPLAIILYFNAGDKNRTGSRSSSSELENPGDELEFLLANGADSELMVYSQNLSQVYATRMLPLQLSAFQERLQIAEELIRRGNEAKSVRFGVITKINALADLVSFERNLAQDSQQRLSDLLAFCEQYANDADPIIRARAKLGEFVVRIHLYLQSPTDQEFATLDSMIDQFVADLKTDADPVQQVSSLVTLMSTSKNLDHIESFNRHFVQRLQKSDDAVMREIGDAILDKIIVGSINYDDIRRLLQASDESTLLKLKELASTIAANPEISVSAYYNFLTAIETLLQISQGELENQLMEQLKASAGKIANEDKRKDVLKFFDDHEVRNHLKGQQFDLGSVVDSQPTEENAVRTVVLFFSATHQFSNEWVVLLASLADQLPTAGRYVLVCTSPNQDEKYRNHIMEGFPSGILIGEEEVAHYLEQCPISEVPYVIILDGGNRVVDVNVDIDKIRTHLQNPNQPIDN